MPGTVAERFADHALGLDYDAVSAEAVQQAKVFILDTLGVGIAGSTAAGAAEALSALAGWGAGDESVLWGRAARGPAPAAALLNAFQVHCQEYDCVHEGAVLHPLATLLPALLAHADRAGGVSGRDLLTACVAGVDIASGLGIASKSAMRFFRPATAGGFGAAAGLGRLMGLTREQLQDAFGLQYAQSSGTLQPHVEGSPALPMQVGFNSRAALQACDLAAAGFPGPHDVFEGPYGYMRLFEGEWDFGPVLHSLGQRWRIAEVSHKPYPAGRATHAGVEAIMRLQAEHGFAADDVAEIVVTGPPVTQRLCGRAPLPSPSANYARLCMAFVAAKVLIHGEIDLAHYRGAALTDPMTYQLAQRVRMVADDNPDPNALLPVHTAITLKDGRVLRWTCTAMLASPGRRLTREQHLRKFHRCWSFSAAPLPEAQRDALIAMVDDLDRLGDVRDLTRLLSPA
ncbi:MAG: MmgE/PrpD family protein [Janthinobacterium lividum]